MVYKNYEVEFVENGRGGVNLKVRTETFPMTVQEVIKVLTNPNVELKRLLENAIDAYEFERDPAWGNVGRGEI